MLSNLFDQIDLDRPNPALVSGLRIGQYTVRYANYCATPVEYIHRVLFGGGLVSSSKFLLVQISLSAPLRNISLLFCP